MAAMFTALGDPVRLRLFSEIASHPAGEACVCEISDVGVSQPTVSHRLTKLRAAGLLLSERRGTWVCYRVCPTVLAGLAGALTGVRDTAARPAGTMTGTARAGGGKSPGYPVR